MQGDGAASRTETAYQATVQVSTFKISYGCVTMRGYYPQSRGKPNQDSHVELPYFGQDPPDESDSGRKHMSEQAFFGVFDGHGTAGHKVSQYVRDVLPGELLKAMGEFPDNLQRAYKEAFQRSDTLVHNDRSVEDKLSGTTAVSVLVKDGHLIIANVGDSRVIVGQRKEGKLLAFPLSIDQTPHRQDEYNRVRSCGARIMSQEQLDGSREWHDDWQMDLDELAESDDDPPRIWLPNDSMPGCGFTRSLGDRVAKSIGVSALPELLEKQLSDEDEYLVLCSDGVFEFISNQMCMDIVAACGEPLAACHALIQEAYKLWLQFDTRTDDITATVLRLRRASNPLEQPIVRQSGQQYLVGRASALASLRERSQSSRMTLVRRSSARGIGGIGNDVVSNANLRPVRRNMTKNKRALVVKSLRGSDAGTDESPPVELRGPIATDERKRLLEAVRGNFLFSHLDEQQQLRVIDEMETVACTAGVRVIEQGCRGDWFYVVRDGQLEVLIAAPDGDNNGSGPKETVVYEYNASRKGPAPSFGDLALLYSKERAASVRARTDCVLWRLHRDAFRRTLKKSSAAELTGVLRKVDILQSLSRCEMQELAESLSQVHFEPGETVIKQGEMSSAMYIISEGKAIVTRHTAGSQQEEELMRLGVGDYFGERALLLDAPRAASVTAKSRLSLFYIGRQAFEDVLGPLETIINHDRRLRERSAYVAHLQAEADELLDASPGSFALQHEVLSDETCATHLAVCAATGRTHSLRVWSKARVVAENQQLPTLNAAAVLGSMRSPPSRFVPQVIAAFTDERRLFSVLSSQVVCELSTLLESGPFGEGTAQYYTGCLLLALEALQYENIALRTLSPESVVLTVDGLAQPFDFRMAKQISRSSDGRTYSICGPPHFMAPEMLRGTGHGTEVDLWALGVLLFQVLSGKLPFEGETELELFTRIRAHVGTTREPKGAEWLQLPSDFSEEACDLINILLDPIPAERDLWGTGLEMLRQHAFFEGLDWEALWHGELPAPHRAELDRRLEGLLLTPRTTAAELNARHRRVQNEPLQKGADDWCEDFEDYCRFYTMQRVGP